jgi:CSLREA domain-containing protein
MPNTTLPQRQSNALYILVFLTLLLWPTPTASAVEETITQCTAAALLAEVADPSVSTVRFDCGEPATIALSEPLVLARALRIEGEGLITLTRAGSGRVVEVLAGTAVELAGLTISGGQAPGASGGGILNAGSLSLEDVLLADNSAAEGGAIVTSGPLEILRGELHGNRADGDGGALLALPGSHVSLNDVGLHGNTAGSQGGAIATTAPLTMTGVLLSANSAADGGALAIQGADATVRDSELSGNQVSGDGGAIWSNGTLALLGSTVAENRAGNGGAIDAGGTLSLTNSTVSGNRASGDGGGITSRGVLALTATTVAANAADTGGGGLAVLAGSATLTSTLLAGNQAAVGPDCLGVLASGGANLLEQTASCQLTAADNLLQVDPQLQPLADNGGPGRTHALPAGSPAVDAVSDGNCATLTDGRGVNRPIGTRCDIGALELGFVVNSLADAPDFNPAAVACDSTPDGGVCTLRAAIQQANNLFGRQAITFAVEGVITLDAQYAVLEVTQDLIILGRGAGLTIVDGGGNPALTGVFDVAAGTHVTLAGMTIRNGNAGAARAGGGLRNAGTLELRDSVVSGNSTDATGHGGGIANSETGTLRLSRVAVSGNSAGSGAGIDNRGALVLEDSTLSSNSAGSELAGGGGLATSGSARLTNVTISGNSAAHNGGGIAVTGGGGDALRLNNVTIAGNAANSDADVAGDGGGIFVRAASADVLLANTLLADNRDGGGAAVRPDCAGSLRSLGYNLLGVNNSCIETQRTGDLFGTPAIPLGARLGPLRSNGGPTQTRSLLTGSPAINAGSRARPGGQGNACAAADQRGAARPTGAACDIGAAEVPLADLRLTQSLESANPLVGRELRYAVTVTNDGPSATAAVELLIALPFPVRADAGSIEYGTCSSVSGGVTCTLGTLGSGTSATVEIILWLDRAGARTIETSVNAAEADPTPANNRSDARLHVDYGQFLPLIGR